MEFRFQVKKRMVDIDHPETRKKRVGLFDLRGAIQNMFRSNKELTTSKRNQSKNQQCEQIINIYNSENPEHSASGLIIY